MNTQTPSKQPHDNDLPLSLEEAAYLSGGYDRIAHAFIACMVRAGRLDLSDARRLRLKASNTKAVAGPPRRIEQVAAVGGTIRDACLAIATEAKSIPVELGRRGLTMSARARAVRIGLSIALFAFGIGSILGFGATGVGALLGVSALLGAWLTQLAALRTYRAGRRALAQTKAAWRETIWPAKPLDSPSVWAWRCALYGPGALVGADADKIGSALRNSRKRPRYASGWIFGCSAAGESFGGGGGCGGGCGGCGG